jgi:uncharacterized protein YvpB
LKLPNPLPNKRSKNFFWANTKALTILANAYKELEKKLGSKEEDLRGKLLEELQAEAFKDRPASAGDYQLPEVLNAEEAVEQ